MFEMVLWRNIHSIIQYTNKTNYIKHACIHIQIYISHAREKKLFLS
jgi:hypothetical protein